MRLFLLSILVTLFSFNPETSFADIHDDIERCDVLNDANCLRSLLHRMASGGGGGGPQGWLEYSCSGAIYVTLRDSSGNGIRIGIIDINNYRVANCNARISILNSNDKKRSFSQGAFFVRIPFEDRRWREYRISGDGVSLTKTERCSGTIQECGEMADSYNGN